MSRRPGFLAIAWLGTNAAAWSGDAPALSGCWVGGHTHGCPRKLNGQAVCAGLSLPNLAPNLCHLAPLWFLPHMSLSVLAQTVFVERFGPGVRVPSVLRSCACTMLAPTLRQKFPGLGEYSPGPGEYSAAATAATATAPLPAAVRLASQPFVEAWRLDSWAVRWGAVAAPVKQREARHGKVALPAARRASSAAAGGRCTPAAAAAGGGAHVGVADAAGGMADAGAGARQT